MVTIYNYSPGSFLQRKCSQPNEKGRSCFEMFTTSFIPILLGRKAYVVSYISIDVIYLIRFSSFHFIYFIRTFSEE